MNLTDFLSYMPVDTKELGRIRLGQNLMGTQRYLLEQLRKGIDDDVHFFVVCKGRQLGISVFCLGMDLYYVSANPGMQGTLVLDTDVNRELFRTNLNQFHAGLPKQVRYNILTHNRTQLVLSNGSRLSYQVAGVTKRAISTLGQGQAVNYVHGTEVSSWADEEGLASLMSSMAGKHPKRLYLFESTPRGDNMFKDMWDTARKSRIQKAVFIGWWLNEFYSFAPDTPQYRVYKGKAAGKEREWVKDIKTLYDHTITENQLVWWRYMLEEQYGENDLLMQQEYPPCVVADTRVGTARGILPIVDVCQNDILGPGHIVEKSIESGSAQIYELKTSLGYSFRGTWDHPVVSEAGVLIPMRDALGSTIRLRPPKVADQFYKVEWRDGVISSEVVIERLLARFVGIFMGDGSLHGDTLSIVCDTKDQDFISMVEGLINTLFKVECHIRQVGPNKGGTEIRVKSKLIGSTLRKLGLTHNDTGPTMRKVHVPEFIFQSPRKVIAEFLSGLFETDGFIDRRGNRIVLFSKYDKFLADVQLLLLTFGITCRRKSGFIKKSLGKDGKVCEYAANELTLRKEEVHAFCNEIGFFSERKQSRQAKRTKPHTNQKRMALVDKVVSVSESGYEPVYNLTVRDDHLFDSNGILTHNTENHAFVLTGAKFFSPHKITFAWHHMQHMAAPKYLRFHFGIQFDDTYIEECDEAIAQLKIWREPQMGGIYSIGADPSFGASQDSDNFGLQVIRCYADHAEQVAEFQCNDIGTYEFLWVMLYLAGYYKNCTLVMEVNGPGQAVLQEYKRFKSLVNTGLYGGGGQVFRQIKEYMYTRADSYNGSFCRQWKTDSNSKERMLNAFKDLMLRDWITLRSVNLLDEMKRFSRSPDGYIETTGASPDLVMSMGMAVIGWLEDALKKCARLNITKKRAEEMDKINNPGNIVYDYLKSVGINA